MYAIGTMPLIQQLPKQCKSAWFADDATAGGRLNNIKTWWNSIKNLGPKFGYTPNAEKNWLIVREEALKQAQCIFHDSGINISSKGAPLGSSAFIQSFVESKVTNWVKQIKQLATIAKTQPQDAYAALTHSLMFRWTYLIRTVPEVGNLFDQSPWKMPSVYIYYQQLQVTQDLQTRREKALCTSSKTWWTGYRNTITNGP